MSQTPKKSSIVVSVILEELLGVSLAKTAQP